MAELGDDEDEELSEFPDVQDEGISDPLEAAWIADEDGTEGDDVEDLEATPLPPRVQPLPPRVKPRLQAITGGRAVPPPAATTRRAVPPPATSKAQPKAPVKRPVGAPTMFVGKGSLYGAGTSIVPVPKGAPKNAAQVAGAKYLASLARMVSGSHVAPVLCKLSADQRSRVRAQILVLQDGRVVICK